MVSTTRHDARHWFPSVVFVCFALLLLDSVSVHAATETVTLSNGKTFKVKTKDGWPTPVNNRNIEMTFMGQVASADAEDLDWKWMARLKRKGTFTVTVTTPVDDTVSASFEATGPGNIAYEMFDSEEYPTLWTWIDDEEPTWFPFVFTFQDTASDKSFEVMQWGKYSAGQVQAVTALAEKRRSEQESGQALARTESIAVQFDERDWRLDHRSVTEDQEVLEYVLPDETVEDWRELVTVQSLTGLPDTTTPEELMLGAKQSTLVDCPDAMWNVISQSNDEIVYEWRTENCTGPYDSDDQYEVSKILKGRSALHRVAYTTKRQPYLPEPERSEWIRRVAGAEINPESARTDGAPPTSSRAKKRFLVKAGQEQSADSGPRPAPRVPTGAYLIEGGQISVLGDFPRPYPTVPTRAFLVEGGAIGIQAGVRPDYKRPPLMPFGKQKYPTIYFVFLTNETDRPIWTEIQMSFPVRGNKTADRTVSESKRDPFEDHRNTRGFLQEAYGVVADKRIPIRILVYSDEERRNLIGEEVTFMYFPKESVRAFLKEYRSALPLYGWPEIGVPDSGIPGTLADAGLQSAIQYTLWKEESKANRDCEHKALRAESVDLEHSTIVSPLVEETREGSPSSSGRKNILVERWLVRSCEVTIQYEVLLAETPEAGADIIVREMDDSTGLGAQHE